MQYSVLLLSFICKKNQQVNKIQESVKPSNTDHVPLHFYCKSHTVEGLDRSIIQVLVGIEQQIKLRGRIEVINPAIRRFTLVKFCDYHED